MFYALLIVHVMVSFFLIFVVLLQTGRGAELGAAFGGMGQTTFGRGQATFITKFTTALAVIFMSTSLSLAFISSEQPTRSVISPQALAPVSAPGGVTEQAAEPARQAGQGTPAPPEQEPLQQTKAPPNPNPSPPEKQ